MVFHSAACMAGRLRPRDYENTIFVVNEILSLTHVVMAGRSRRADTFRRALGPEVVYTLYGSLLTEMYDARVSFHTLREHKAKVCPRYATPT